MRRANQLHTDHAMVLIIDVQEKLLPLIERPKALIHTLEKLLEGVGVFELPVLVTEQYPKGLGPTVAALLERVENSRTVVVEKPTFSAWAHEPVREALLRYDRPQIILAGVETHVCVQQTALDLISRDYDVFVCADAAGARGSLNHEIALDRMRQEGAWVTTVESVLFELCQRCDTERFKKMIEVIKRRPPEADA